MEVTEEYRRTGDERCDVTDPSGWVCVREVMVHS